MDVYGDFARSVVRRNIGQARYDEICSQFGLTEADREVLNRLLSEWRPERGPGYAWEVVEKYKDIPNIERIMAAWELMTKESAAISSRDRFHNRGHHN